MGSCSPLGLNLLDANNLDGRFVRFEGQNNSILHNASTFAINSILHNASTFAINSSTANGVYGSDLAVAQHGTYRKRPVPQYQDEFRRAFEFAARYAGYHASPKRSPRAWVAFREGTFLTGDYTFLMERLPDDSTERRLVGPEQQRFGAWARAIPTRATMRLRPDREFVQSLAGRPGQLRIVYLDSGTDSLSLSLQDLSWQIPRTDTGHWREYLAPIDRFPAIVEGLSLEISLRGGSTEAVLHMVELARGDRRAIATPIPAFD